MAHEEEPEHSRVTILKLASVANLRAERAQANLRDVPVSCRVGIGTGTVRKVLYGDGVSLRSARAIAAMLGKGTPRSWHSRGAETAP